MGEALRGDEGGREVRSWATGIPARRSDKCEHLVPSSSLASLPSCAPQRLSPRKPRGGARRPPPLKELFAATWGAFAACRSPGAQWSFCCSYQELLQPPGESDNGSTGVKRSLEARLEGRRQDILRRREAGS